MIYCHHNAAFALEAMLILSIMYFCDYARQLCFLFMSKSRGVFIVFEGVDRCGKSTQVRKLTESLRDRGLKAVSMGFPG